MCVGVVGLFFLSLFVFVLLFSCLLNLQELDLQYLYGLVSLLLLRRGRRRRSCRRL